MFQLSQKVSQLVFIPLTSKSAIRPNEVRIGKEVMLGMVLLSLRVRTVTAATITTIINFFLFLYELFNELLVDLIEDFEFGKCLEVLPKFPEAQVFPCIVHESGKPYDTLRERRRPDGSCVNCA